VLEKSWSYTESLLQQR